MQANANIIFNHSSPVFNSPMSSSASSPFSSPEAAAEMEILDMPFSTDLYQQVFFDLDTSANLLIQQQQPYQIPSVQHKIQQQQPLQYGVNQMGLGTPPTSPHAPAFNKFLGSNEINMYYPGSQPQAGQNVPSPITSSCSGSLSSSPYAESPLMANGFDFELFGYPTAPIMMSQTPIYSQPGTVYPQMTPPMHQMDLEDASLFRHDAINAGLNDHQHQQEVATTELSLLCNSPGKFPCCEHLPGTDDSTTSHGSSPLQDIQENEYSESESLSSEEDQEDGEESEQDPSYEPSPRARSNTTGAIHAPKSMTKARSKSMTISTGSNSVSPYGSPYAKDLASPKTPVRHDRRRSGSYTAGGHSHHHQLLNPEDVPEIKDIHVCPVCQRRFTRPFNLRSHLMTHTTARPFPCDECHWKFTRQHDLLRHKRAKHPNSVDGGQHKKDTKSRTVSAA